MIKWLINLVIYFCRVGYEFLIILGVVILVFFLLTKWADHTNRKKGKDPGKELKVKSACKILLVLIALGIITGWMSLLMAVITGSITAICMLISK